MIRRITFAAAWLVSALILTAAPAHADRVDTYTVFAAPAVCSTLDQFPTVAGVAGVGDGIVADSGFTYFQAGRVIADAVNGWCPRHLPLLQRFVAVYGPKHQIV